jgi:hypothetical protein
MKIKNTCILVCMLLSPAAFAATIVVPGTADLWLAGMPNGSTASLGDVAPDESPMLVTGISITGGIHYTFSSSGTVSRGSPLPFFGPDGESGIDDHWTGAENGIGNITTPLESLIGVFLGPVAPNLNSAPAALDFTSASSRDYLTLSPALQQPFFIGDGLTSLGAVQQIVAPAGATRLFLGTMDEYGWYNNEGSFTVQVAPEPATITFGTLGALSLLAINRFRRKS